MRILCYVNFTLTEKKKKEQNQGHHRFPLEPLVEIGDRALRIKAQLDDSPRLGDGAGYTAREQQGQTTNQASCLPAQSSFCQRASELPQNQSPAKLSTHVSKANPSHLQDQVLPLQDTLCVQLWAYATNQPNSSVHQPTCQCFYGWLGHYLLVIYDLH